MSKADRIKYAALIDLPRLQALMESFSQVIGLANAVVDVDGIVLIHSGWQDACTGFHRVNEKTCRRCVESDTSLANSMMRGASFAIYRCLNGLVDAAAPIIVDGQHVANVFTGQFLPAPPSLGFYHKQAQQFGFDEARYLEAIAKVPVLSQERVESVTRLYAQLAAMLAAQGLDRIREIKTAEELANLNKTLEEQVAMRTQALARANDDLAGREALLKQILDTSSVAIFLVDTEGRIIQANQRMAEMFGYSLDALVGNEYVALIHPAEREIGRQRMAALLVSAIPSVDLDRLYWRTDQTEFWGHLTGKRFYDNSGAARGLIGVIADITERKRAEVDLRIAAIAFEAQEAMFITDAAQIILRVNGAFTHMTGYNANEAVGRTPRLLASGRHDSSFFSAIMDNIQRTGTWQGDIWNRRKCGEIYPAWITITSVKDAAGVLTHYVCTMTDISMRKAAQDVIKNLAFYDPLTGLPNRRLLLDRLKQALASSARSEKYGALLFIDLDNFKALNDTLGHDIGDLLLKQVGQRLSTCVREGDTVSRLGGDEFVVVLVNLSENVQEAAAHAKILGEKILVTLNQPYQLAGYESHSTLSIGVTLFDDYHGTIDDLLKRADLAMYQAKAAGRNTLRFFDPEMQAVVTARAALNNDLRAAVREEQFILYYQEQVDAAGSRVGAEALVRWQHPQRGMVFPDEFIPLAEESGLILPIGNWVLQTACAQLAVWATQPSMAHLTLAVNVSARQFRHADFVEQVLAVIERTGANPHRLKLELTESLLIHDVEEMIAKMNTLKTKGLSFSLDDFGTGYSSLSYLKRLPLDQLKIDQGFVRDILIDPNDAAIAKMVVALAESLGITVIAEGVETEAQRNALAAEGCHAYQGYLFGYPLPLEEFDRGAGHKLERRWH